MRKKDSGFTLIEILVTIGISAILMTLGASAVRGYWLGRALNDGAEEVVTGMREMQERSVSESHPLVYGVWFKTNSQTWGSLRYDSNDPAVSGDDTCTSIGNHKLPDGVRVQSASFLDASPQTTTCASSAPAGAEIVFFFARGTATGGDLTLVQLHKDQTETLEVSSLTGRVERQ